MPFESWDDVHAYLSAEQAGGARDRTKRLDALLSDAQERTGVPMRHLLGAVTQAVAAGKTFVWASKDPMPHEGKMPSQAPGLLADRTKFFAGSPPVVVLHVGNGRVEWFDLTADNEHQIDFCVRTYVYVMREHLSPYRAKEKAFLTFAVDVATLLRNAQLGGGGYINLAGSGWDLTAALSDLAWNVIGE